MTREYCNPELSASASRRAESAPVLPEQYEVLAKVSEGGMGAIYKARNRYTGATFAIKVLRPELAQDYEYRKRFEIEARAAGSLKHPNICQVFDFGITGGQTLYLVMDWVEGTNLASGVRRHGPLDVSSAVTVFRQIAMALSHAHKNGIVHRDIKPDNIILSREPESGAIHAYLVDFGVAKVLSEAKPGAGEKGLTVCGTVVGTPMYMSPEQAREQEVDGRSDLYSLGCVMYFLVTGKAPFVADTAMDTMLMHINETPAEISSSIKVPADLKKIVFKCLEKAPSDRYDDAGKLLLDLEKLASGVSLGRISLASDRQRWRQKAIILGLFFLGFIVMFVISSVVQSFFEKPEGIINKQPVSNSGTKTVPH